MVKPFKVFVYVSLTIGLLLIISLLVPTQGIRLLSYTIKYPSAKALFNLDASESNSAFILHPEIEELGVMLDSLLVLDFQSDTLHTLAHAPVDSIVDSIATHPLSPVQENYVAASAEALKKRLVRLELPDSTFDAMYPFFKDLCNGAVSRQQVRVMHFGDSQIEGDRITSFLRSRLQARFGGGGVGLLNAYPHSYQPGAVHQSISSNWQFISIADMPKGGVGGGFGVFGGYSVFKSSRKTRGGFTEAWIDLEKRGTHSARARNYTNCKVLYGRADEPFMLSVTYMGQTQDAEFLSPTGSPSSFSWVIPSEARRIRLNFRGDESPWIYGISLETSQGIVVDNLAVRGSSGVDFTRAEEATFKKTMELVKPKLIILQFGVNMVPHIVSSYSYYEQQLYQQILMLKRVCPNASIVLIGVSDMSRKVDGKFQSYPNIVAIRDAQRSAALRAGAAFWDCYKAMGGENSMPAWVYASPPLASKDFVHFTSRGSNIVAEMFYSALMQLYAEYCEQ